MIDLYFWPTSNNKKVTIMLHEVGLPYRVKLVNFIKGENYTTEFLALNPNAKTRKGKPNAFAYLSYIMNNSFTNVIEKEKLQAYYKYKSLELAGGPEGGAAQFHLT